MSVTRIGVVAPRAGELVVSLDVRGEWPSAPERLARTDRVCHLALLAAYRALGEPPGVPRPFAVVYGTAHASLVTNLRYYEKIQRRGSRGADPKRFPYTSPNAAAGEVAIAFGLVGPSVTLATGGAAGVEALVAGARLVARGRAPAALVIAADAWADETARWLEHAGLEPAAGPREGAAAVLLEPEGAERAIAMLEGLRSGRRARSATPMSPAPAAMLGVGAITCDLEAQCPLSGNWAAARWVAPVP